MIERIDIHDAFSKNIEWKICTEYADVMTAQMDTHDTHGKK